MKEAESKVVTPIAHALPGGSEARAKTMAPVVRSAAPMGSQDIHVGPSTRLSGGFNTLGMMIVDGRVDEADIAADRLVVSHIGELQGCAKVHRAEISGVFDGELIAADEVIVRPTARIAGVVRCRRLVIHRGARIECSFSCDPVDGDGVEPAPARPHNTPSRWLTRDRRNFFFGVASVFAVIGALSLLGALRTVIAG